MLGLQEREIEVLFDICYGNGGFKTEALTKEISVRTRKDIVERLKEPVKFTHEVDGKTVCEVMIEFIIVSGESISELRNICVRVAREDYYEFGDEIAKSVQDFLNNEVIESICDKQQAFEESFEKNLPSVLIGVKRDTDFVVKIQYDVEFEQSFKNLNAFDASTLYLVNGVLYSEIDKGDLMKHLYSYEYLLRDGVIIVNGDRCFMEKYQA